TTAPSGATSNFTPIPSIATTRGGPGRGINDGPDATGISAELPSHSRVAPESLGAQLMLSLDRFVGPKSMPSIFPVTDHLTLILPLALGAMRLTSRSWPWRTLSVSQPTLVV